MEEEIKIRKIDSFEEYLPLIDVEEAGENIYDEVEKNSEETFAIDCGGKIVGVAYIEDDPEAFIYVYIFKEYRNKGLGTLAVKAVEERLTAEPKLIETTYRDGDEIAKKFAEKCGYKRKFASAKMGYTGEKFEEEQLPIRKYKDEDYTEAFILSAEAFHRMRLSTGCFPDSVVGEPSDKSRKYWAETADERYIYVLGDEIVGSALLDEEELDVVSIKISRQGEGLGRKFVKYLTNRIIEKDIGAPVLWCVVGNDKARNLYDSLGYKEIWRSAFAEKKIGR